MKFLKPNIFFGNSNLNLFNNIIKIFNIKNNFLFIEKFKDGEFKISLKKNISGKNIFLFQSLNYPIHDNIIELFLLIDIFKKNFAKKIFIFIPYFCYSRQDKKFEKFTSISIKMITSILDSFLIKRIICLDPHSKNFECFFNNEIKILNSFSLIINDIIKRNINVDIIISPDIGGIERAKKIANYLNLELVIIDKRRPIINNIKIFCIIGNIINKNSIIIDDIIDTCNSLLELSIFLKFHKISSIISYITHGLFSNKSYNKIIHSNINEIIISDTIKFNFSNKKIKIITTKYLFIEEIKKILIEENEF